MSQYPPAPTYIVQQSGQSGLGIASFILGLTAFLGCWLPVAGLLLAALGLLFGFFGLMSNRGKGLAVAGLVINFLALIPALFVMLVLGGAVAAGLSTPTTRPTTTTAPVLQELPPVTTNPVTPDEVIPDTAITDEPTGDAEPAAPVVEPDPAPPAAPEAPAPVAPVVTPPPAAPVVKPKPAAPAFKLPKNIKGNPKLVALVRRVRADEVKPYEMGGKVWRYDLIYNRQQVAISLIWINLDGGHWRVAEMSTDRKGGKQIDATTVLKRFGGATGRPRS